MGQKQLYTGQLCMRYSWRKHEEAEIKSLDIERYMGKNKEITTITEMVQAGISTQQGLDSPMRQTLDMSVSGCLGSSNWSEKAFLDLGSAILCDRLNEEYKVN